MRTSLCRLVIQSLSQQLKHSKYLGSTLPYDSCAHFKHDLHLYQSSFCLTSSSEPYMALQIQLESASATETLALLFREHCFFFGNCFLFFRFLYNVSCVFLMTTFPVFHSQSLFHWSHIFKILFKILS
jgi:hypothetical protein